MSTGDHSVRRSLESHPRESENGLHSHQPRPDNLVNHSRIPALSPRHGAKPRITFSQTRTLKGAFQAATSPPAGSDDGQRTSRRYSLGKERKPAAMSPDSEISSPPGELLETYKRINDADNLVDLVYDFPSDQARLDRMQHLSPSPGTRQHGSEDGSAGDTYDSNMSFLEDVTDESLRKKLTKHTIDEHRLKRVTRKDSLFFSNAKGGSIGLITASSAEDPQQRMEEEETHQEAEPSLNIPKSWGARGKVSTDWLSKINRMNGGSRLESDSEQLPVQEWENDIDFTARSVQVSDSPPVRNNFQTKEEIENLAKKGLTTNRLGEIKRRASQEHMQPSTDGNPIPNTPVVVYKGSSREKARILERSDSQELLRRLARAESPSSISTPEQKPAEMNGLAVNTPVVTGAWIDTPIPDRGADLPAELSKDAIPPNRKVPQSTSQTHKESQTESQRPPTKPQLNPPRASTAKLEKPKLPKSALETVIEDARSGDHSLVLGENTIESLQDLLDEMPTFTELKDADEVQSETSEGEHMDMPLETDTVVIHRLNAKLQSLVRSINDATALLTNLEHRVSKDIALLTSRKVAQPKKDGPHRHDGVQCESCAFHGNGRLYITVPIPRLWRRHPDTNRLRPTRLSLFLLTFSAWCLAEFVMCDYYCHPLYAATCERNCLDPSAPRMPYVVPTMLWRWSHLSAVLTPLWTITIALFRFAAQLLGLWDGFVDVPLWGDAGVRNVHVGAAWDQRVSGSDLSMMNDEYL